MRGNASYPEKYVHAPMSLGESGIFSSETFPSPLPHPCAEKQGTGQHDWNVL